MIKKFNEYLNESVSKKSLGKSIDEIEDNIRYLLEEAYEKGYVYSTIDFFILEHTMEKLFSEYIMNDFLSLKERRPEFYVKYKDSVMIIKYEIHRHFNTAVYKEATVDEFKNMLETSLEKLK